MIQPDDNLEKFSSGEPAFRCALRYLRQNIEMELETSAVFRTESRILTDHHLDRLMSDPDAPEVMPIKAIVPMPDGSRVEYALSCAGGIIAAKGPGQVFRPSPPRPRNLPRPRC